VNKTVAALARKRKSEPAVSSLMERLSSYIAAAINKPLPKHVVEKTKHHVLDTLAAMISGTQLLPGMKAISFMRTVRGTKEACVVGTRLVLPADQAALANGMLAHADETDDSHSPSFCHPGCSIVAASLAMAERHRRSGVELLRAVALGYDIGTRVNMSLDAKEFRADGHSTHSFGPAFGCAVAGGALAGVNVRQARHLLSYAAQQASGISCWMRDEEHVEKAFDFGGLAARNGVSAAMMVAHGFTGVEDVFSGERSFFVAYGRRPDPLELIRELGKTFEIVNTNIKRWPVGSPIQAPLDSLLALITKHRLKPDDIEHALIRVSHQGGNTVDNRSMPDICLQHLCAVMLIDGFVSFASAHDEPRMRDRTVLEMRSRVELRGDDALERALPSRQAIVELRLKTGQTLRHHTQNVRGTAENPMVRDEVHEKAFHLIAPVYGEKRAERLCDAVWSIEDVKDVRELRSILQK
jgi:2-methylcitrate dehydratase PrpD